MRRTSGNRVVPVVIAVTFAVAVSVVVVMSAVIVAVVVVVRVFCIIAAKCGCPASKTLQNIAPKRPLRVTRSSWWRKYTFSCIENGLNRK